MLVVDDSPFIRRAVQRMLEPMETVEIVGTAGDGREAVEEAERLRPDVVILDIVMPEVDGLAAIRGIMERAPAGILVLSSQAQPGADITLRALELGAVDFVSKSEAGTRMDIYELAPVLREKVAAVAASRIPLEAEPAGPVGPVGPVEEAPEPVAPAVSRYDVLALGASTGGPRALTAIVSHLPESFPAGVVVAQHMPPGFTRTLADRLNRRARVEVREASDGDPIEPGLVLVGVGGRQMRVERKDGQLTVRVPMGPERFLHRPSVDVLFRSVAEAVRERAVGVVLTGMGNDGAEGLRAIRDAGGRTLAESEETAVIYGMPRAARSAAEQVLPLDRLPDAIRRIFEGREDI